ncbi:ester cyclase [Aquisphaera insulae]|uniref:ester cyclase n=1 Tax=Aquisphaera insulae TaxID=2712864 RepID=UPI0013EABBB9|nr:ester cyclase [Aquisphaera insulae]
MSKDNVILARRWFEEVWNQRRTDHIDEFVTDQSICHSESGPLRSKQEFKERVHDVLLSAFPDLTVTVEGTVAEGDAVVVRWSVRGTHLGDGLGFPATGKEVDFRGMSWLAFADGKVLESWDSWNQGGLMQTLCPPGPSPSREDSPGEGCRLDDMRKVGSGGTPATSSS